MSDQYQRRLALLAEAGNRDLLAEGLRGIEREALRIDADGQLSQAPHPVSLGSALTHEQITTDYSEALLEFITPAEHDAATVLQRLAAIHRFSLSVLGAEMISSQSMPTRLPAEEQIPIAWYGQSHIGMLKHVYRRGLALRYGRAMQCISGIHYNYSLPPALWNLLRRAEKSAESAQDFQSEAYIALIRNFHRYSWLLMYLFGASPTLATEFLQGRAHKLETLSPDTLYLPYATSLRMSDLGYSNNAQAGLVPPYNTLGDYMRSLTRAVRQPWPDYEKIGTKRDGAWWQINTNILQIENEFYATIRPKRVIKSGERPLEALCARGVEYIEVRCMDVNPFDPLGIDLQTTRFLDAFLLFCALEESGPTGDAEGKENRANFSSVVKDGRRPGLMLARGGKPLALAEWANELLERIGPAAALLDAQAGHGEYRAALLAQRPKIEDPDKTPSARVLEAVREHGNSLHAFAMDMSRQHAAALRAQGPSAQERVAFEAMARDSLARQAQMEAEQKPEDFDAFIEAYRAHIPAQLCCGQ